MVLGTGIGLFFRGSGPTSCWHWGVMFFSCSQAKPVKLKQGHQQLNSIAWRLLELQFSVISLTSSANPLRCVLLRWDGHRGKKKSLTKILISFFIREMILGRDSRTLDHHQKLVERSFSLSHSSGPNLQKHEQTCILLLVFFLGLLCLYL